MRRFFDYEPIPFYFLNDEFDKEEIIKQLDCFSASGIKACFLHVRDGVKNSPWGTERFYNNMKFIVEEAKKRGIKPWLYDEDSFPSGQAGGKIVIDRPELMGYGLKVIRVEKDSESGLYKADIGKSKGLFGYAVKTENGKETVRVIENCFGPVRRTWNRRYMTKAYYSDMADLTFNHVRAGTTYTEIMFEAQAEDDEEVYCAYLSPTKTDSKYGTRADCLNIETTKEYIKRVHEKYKEVVGEYFGKEIPGIFLDEPSAGSGLPYTGKLPEVFKREKGYDLQKNLYKLSSSYKGDSKAFRRDYVSVVKKMFTENFIVPIGKWCKKNKLICTGHFNSEEDPLIQALGANDVYDNVGVMGIPGFDIITTYLGDVKHPSLILGANLVASSALHHNKKRVMAESFALSPYNMGYNGLKRCTDWLVACGIDFIVPHGFHYGYNAYQRADAGKSFFYQDPLFPEYIDYSHYAGRLCKIITEYQRSNDILVVIPDGAFAEEIPFPIGNNGIKPSERAVSIRSKFFDVGRYLFTHHTGYDLAETDVVSNAETENGKLRIGKAEYGTVIVIAGGEKEEKVYDEINGKVNTVLFNGNLNDIPLQDVIVKSENTENLLVYNKIRGKDKLCFIFNNSGKYIKFDVKTEDKAVIYNAEKDICERLTVNNGLSTVSLQAYGSVIIESSEKPFAKTDGEYKVEKEKYVDFEYLNNPDLVFMPVGAKKAILNYTVTATVKGEKSVFDNVKFDSLRYFIGTQDDIYKKEYIVPYMDTAIRPESIYPVNAEYSAIVEGNNGEYLLFDGDSVVGECKVFFNGVEVPKEKFEKHRVYDMRNYRFFPEWKEGKNELKFVFINADEFSGVCGEIFVMEK